MDVFEMWQSSDSKLAKSYSILIRMHENRARYEFGGWLQWKPVRAKTWYVMHSHAIVPREMCELFVHEYLPQIEDERAVIKVLGWWNRETKTLTVERIVGRENV